MTIHDKLERLTGDMNRSKIARRVGVTPSAIYSYLPPHGRMPSAAVAFRLAKALNVSMDWLLDDGAAWPPERVENTIPAGAHAA
jgi:transcriptional regulator with XRE-family HTH domain